jgi:hypothetical protein
MKNYKDARREEFEVEDECTCGQCSECRTRQDNEILSDMINEMGDELLNELAELSESECPCCLIKEYLRTIYSIGREDGVKSLANAVANSMMDIIEE